MFDAIIHAPASVESEALPEVRGARSAVTVRNVEVAKPLKAHGAASKFGSSTSTVLYCHCDGGERLVDTALRLDNMMTPGTTMHIKLVNAASIVTKFILLVMSLGPDMMPVRELRSACRVVEVLEAEQLPL